MSIESKTSIFATPIKYATVYPINMNVPSGAGSPIVPTLYERYFDDESDLSSSLVLGGGSLSLFSLDGTVYYGGSGKSLKMDNAGVQVSHNFAIDSSKDALSNDSVFTVRVRLSGTSDPDGPRIGIVARANKSELTGSALILRPQLGNTTMRYSKFNGSTETSLTTNTLSSQLTANTWYVLKFYLLGSVIKGKVWADGDAEPDAWQLETVDLSYDNTSCSVGVCFFSNNDSSDQAWIDSIVETAATVISDGGSTTLGEAFGTLAPNYTAKGTIGITPHSVLASNLSRPYSTNRSYTNVKLKTDADSIKVHPYIARCLNLTLGICYPSSRTASATLITESTIVNWSVLATETIDHRVVQSEDFFTTTNRWVTSGAGYFESPLVTGSPYISVYYSGLTPKLTTIHAILSVNGSGTPGAVTATKFKMTLNNGQTWIIYFDSSVTLTWSNSSGWQMVAGSTFTGWMRVAYLTTSSDEAVLDSYKAKIPTGGSVGLASSSNTGTVTFTWTTTGTGTLAMLALPHHQSLLSSPTPQAELAYLTLMGNTKAVYGSTWIYDLALPTLTWAAPRSPDAGKIDTIKAALASDYTITPSASDPYFGGKSVARSGMLALIADELGETAKAATIRANMKTVINAWLTGTSSPNFVYESVWGGIATERSISNTGYDFGSGYYNDHHFHLGYWVFAAACLAKEDASWLSTYGKYVTDMVREYANPSTNDTYFARFRNFNWFNSHSIASGLYNFGDGTNQESSSEAVNSYYAVYLWGLVTSNDNIKNIGRILLASEIKGAQTYWQMKSADSIYDTVFEANKIYGIKWDTKVDRPTFFCALTEYYSGIQVIPITPMTELLLDPTWAAEAYPVIKSRSIDRDYPYSASITNGGSGFVGSSDSYTQGGVTYLVANNVESSGGSGTGLRFNMNIRQSDGRVTEIYVLDGYEGSGYVDGDLVGLVTGTGGLSGGGGAQFRLNLKPNDAWKNFLYTIESVSDKATAWTHVQELTGFDDGNTKTNMLYWVATRP